MKNLLKLVVVTATIVGAAAMLHAVDPLPFPAGAPKSKTFEVSVDQQTLPVYANGPHSFVSFTLSGKKVDVVVQSQVDIKKAQVRPLSAGIKPVVKGNTVRFTLKQPRKLSIEINGDTNLFLFANPSGLNVPNPETKGVIYFKPGYHDLKDKVLKVKSGQTLYIADGAYLDHVRALLIWNARNVRVCGYGVLAGPTRVFNSNDVLIEGIVITPKLKGWMNRIENSWNVTYRNVKALAGNDKVVNFDGFDIMSGCHHVSIDDVFVRSTDDVFTVKHHPANRNHWSSKAPISHISFTNSVAWNLRGGSIVRIGPETIGPSMDNIAVKNIDVIHNQNGSVFEIRTVDGVRIRQLVFDSIRIEEDYHALIRFDMGNWYKVGCKHGHVDGVYFRNIEIQGGLKACSIQDADATHRFANLFFDNVKVDGKRITEMRDQQITCEKDAKPETDSVRPEIVDCVTIPTEASGDATRVYLAFSEPVTQASAERIDNYSINHDVRIDKASLNPYCQQVVLQTSPLQKGTDYTISVKKLADRSGNTIKTCTKPIRHLPAWRASEGYASFQGKFGWYYEQFNPSDVTIYRNRKDLVMSPRYWLMNYYPAPDGACWTGHKEDAQIKRASQQPGRHYYSVRSWRAPVDGTIEIKGAVTREKPAKGAPKVRILQNGYGVRDREEIVLWDWHQVEAEPVQHTIHTNVQSGDVIRFVVGSNGTDLPVGVLWDPEIRYVEKRQP